MVQQIDDDLEMKVWRPAAVFVDVADAGEELTTRDALAHLKSVKGFSREVAVEREKFQAVARLRDEESRADRSRAARY